MVLARVGVSGMLDGAYNYTGCNPKQVVFRRRSIRRTGSWPIVILDRLPRVQRVVTIHLLSVSYSDTCQSCNPVSVPDEGDAGYITKSEFLSLNFTDTDILSQSALIKLQESKIPSFLVSAGFRVAGETGEPEGLAGTR